MNSGIYIFVSLAFAYWINSSVTTIKEELTTNFLLHENLIFYFRYKCPDGYHSIPDIRNFTMAKRENELQESTILPTDYNCLDLTGKEGNFLFK